MSGLNFSELISSFDLSTWMSLLVISAKTTLVLLGLLMYSNVKIDVYDICSLTAKMLLEQNISKFTGNSYVIGTWYLIGVVISQCYKGDNITKLTAPFKKPKLEWFSQLVDGNFCF